jgi:glycosyltransferase involved in cell wall biosynthesis
MAIRDLGYVSSALEGMRDAPVARPIICFSHLRWHFVWQRPQHLLSRLARNRGVYVVEEPTYAHECASPFLAVEQENGVKILTPMFPEWMFRNNGFGEHINAEIALLLRAYCSRRPHLQEAIVWYYTPMALGSLPANVTPDAVIFDAMDELANFRNAPQQLRHKEQALLGQADLVFAGGPSLYNSRKDHHSDVHCFPSGVDAAHFAQSQRHVVQDMGQFRNRVVGFYGVLDERINFQLLSQLAGLRPDWDVVLIGPTAKITDADLAHQPNIHYLGMRTYDELPAYLARFDAAILPFALNEATAFISPTKTLEYLAGGKPIVSTPIPDVVHLYGDVVELADTAEEFVSAIEARWAEPEDVTRLRQRRIEEILREHDWDAIAERMETLIEQRSRCRQSEIPLARPTAVPSLAIQRIDRPVAASKAGR